MCAVNGEVESVRTASVLAVRARKGALAFDLLKACISGYLEYVFYSVKVEKY
jgi:hypothetical protein